MIFPEEQDELPDETDSLQENDDRNSGYIAGYGNNKTEHSNSKAGHGECIAIVSGKGGTGKTCLTAGIGAALAQNGKRVVCIDCCAGLRNLDLVMGLSDGGLMDFTDVAAGRCTLEDAITEHPKQKNLFLLNAPARVNTSDAPESAVLWERVSNALEAQMSGAAREQFFGITREQMADLVQNVCTEFDFCLLDVPAGLDTGFALAVSAAGRVIVVTLTDPPAVRDAQRAVMELERFPEGDVLLIVNRVRRGLLHRIHVTIDDVMDQTGLPLLGLVPEDHAVPLSLSVQLPVPMAFPNSHAAAACRNIAARLTGKRIPLCRMPW